MNETRKRKMVKSEKSDLLLELKRLTGKFKNRIVIDALKNYKQKIEKEQNNGK